MAWFTKENILTADEMHLIVQAIRVAEAATSGEIRLYIERKCPDGKPLQKAAQVFGELKMHLTKQRNAALIYVAHEDRKLAIFADEGLLQATSQVYWTELAGQMSQHFGQGRFYDGLMLTINTLASRMSELFPPLADEQENELPDDIVFGH